MSAPNKRSAASHSSRPSKRPRGIQKYRRPSLSLPTSADVNVPLTEPSDLLALFTPETSKKLLTSLLNDPALRPGVTTHIQANLAESFPAYISSISKRAYRATEHLQDPEDHREKEIISIGDLAEACAPFLHDVVRAARMPVPGAAREALGLLRRIHNMSLPDYDHLAEGEEERAEFDEGVDDLMVVLLGRMREEGDKQALDEKCLEDLCEELKRTAKDLRENFMVEHVFLDTIGLLEDWLGKTTGSGDGEPEEQSGDSEDDS